MHAAATMMIALNMKWFLATKSTVAAQNVPKIV